MNNLGLQFNEIKAFEEADKILRQAKIQKDTFNKIILANDARSILRGLQRRTWITYRNDPKLNKNGNIIDFYTISKVFEKLQIDALLFQVNSRSIFLFSLRTMPKQPKTKRGQTQPDFFEARCRFVIGEVWVEIVSPGVA